MSVAGSSDQDLMETDNSPLGRPTISLSLARVSVFLVPATKFQGVTDSVVLESKATGLL